MAKPIYLLSYIGNYSAENFARELDANSSEDVNAYINSPGGDVFAGWTMIGKLMEHKGKATAKVGGAAMSMAANMLMYFDEVEALDVSVIMFHRADMYVSTPEDKAFLDGVNKDLRKKMEAKIDSNALKEMKGYSIKDLFENEKRVDLLLTSSEAKKLGIVTKVVKADPKKIQASAGYSPTAMAEFFSDEQPIANKPVHTPTTNIMNLEKLKQEHPDVYAQAVQIGVTAERDRVQAIMVYADADITECKAAIDSAKPLSAKQTQEFLVKMTGANQLSAIAAAAGKPAPVTPAPSADDQAKAAAASLLESVNKMRKQRGEDPYKELPESYKSAILAQS